MYRKITLILTDVGSEYPRRAICWHDGNDYTKTEFYSISRASWDRVVNLAGSFLIVPETLSYNRIYEYDFQNRL